MSDWLNVLVNISLLVMIALLPLAFWRIARRGQNAADRLVGVDLITNLLVGIVILLAVIDQRDTTIDIGIVVAAFSFVGTVSIARYLSEGRVF